MNTNKELSQIASEILGSYGELFRDNNTKSQLTSWITSRIKGTQLFDRHMMTRLYILWREKLNKNNDLVIVIVGREGAGKSTFATQIASWLDPTFNNENIALEREEIIMNVKNSKPGKAMVIDEGAFVLFSRNAMGRNSRELVQLFMFVRQKCMATIICCPSYKEMDSYIRNHRVHMLIDIRKRGEYQAYFGGDLLKVNIDLSKVKAIAAIKVSMQSSWVGNFRQPMPPTIDVATYVEKKKKHLDKFLDTMLSNSKDKEKELKEGGISSTGVDFKSPVGSLLLNTHLTQPQLHLQLLNKALNGRVDTNGG